MLASCFAQGVCMCFVKGGLHIHSLHMLTQGVCSCLLHALLRGSAYTFSAYAYSGGLFMLASCSAQGVCMCFVKGGLHKHYLHMITR